MADNKGLIRDKDFKVTGLSMREAQLIPKGSGKACISAAGMVRHGRRTALSGEYIVPKDNKTGRQ